jgi:HemY protein
MRALIWFLGLLALAVGLALAAHYNDGYVLFVLSPWRVELSLNLLIVLLLACFAAGYLALRAIVNVWRLPAAAREFHRRRVEVHADDELRAALRLFQEGRYGHAIKAAESAFAAGRAPGLAALVGLRAAHALHDSKRLDDWRERARAHDETTRAARLMTEAELAVDSRRFVDAREALNQLAKSEGRHIAALRLALRTEQGQGNWEEVLRLTRQLQKHKALTAEQAAPLRHRAHRENLVLLAGDAESLIRYWRGMPAEDRREVRLALAAARALASANDCGEAAQLVEDFLEDQWDSSLVEAYGECDGGDVLARIAHAEKWLAIHPRDAKVLLTLGRLCRRKQLWGKAQSYLEASLATGPSRATHLELGGLLDSLDRPAEADRQYRIAALLER